MKTYNFKPAYNNITISTRSFCDLKKDEQICLSKKFDSLDFVLWFDEKLIDNKDVSLHLPVFKYIVTSIDKGYITYSGFKNKNFRLACLIFSKFVNCDSLLLKQIRNTFLSDNPDILEFEKDVPEINFDDCFNYNHYQANKSIFSYFKKNGVDYKLVSELIARQFLGFQETGHNIIYVGKDLFDYKSTETHGLGTRHFMRLKGEFPFVYYIENLEKEDCYKYSRFDRIEVFDTSLSMLQYLSNNKIYYNVVYCSVHTENYNVSCLKNLLKIFGDLPLHFHFANKKEIPEIRDTKQLEKIINDVENYTNGDVERDTMRAINKELSKNHKEYNNEKIISLLRILYNKDFTFNGYEKENRIFISEDKLEVYEDGTEKDLPF